VPTSTLAKEAAVYPMEPKRKTEAVRQPMPISPVAILSVSPFAEDHMALRRILRQPQWHISTASSCIEAADRLYGSYVAIVVCESDLPDGSWRDLLGYAGERRDAPHLIVTSRMADTYLWAEVLNLGGYDVLAKPFDEEEVLRVIESARQARRRPAVLARAAGA